MLLLSCCAVLCYAMLCCALTFFVLYFVSVLCRAVLCRAVLCRAVPCRAVLCRDVLCCAVPCCAALCSAVLCCAVLYRAMLLYRETGDPIGAAALFLRGFSSVKALLPAESRHLRVLVASRLAATYTLGAYSQQFVSISALAFLLVLCVFWPLVLVLGLLWACHGFCLVWHGLVLV